MDTKSTKSKSEEDINEFVFSRKILKEKIREVFKNKKKNISRLFNFTIIILMISLSFLMIYRYHFIGLKVLNNKKVVFQNEEYLNDIYDTNYYLYYKVKRNETGKSLKPDNLYLSNSVIESMIENINVDYYTSELDSQSIKFAFNNNFSILGEFLEKSKGKLKYSCENLTSGYKIENYGFYLRYSSLKENPEAFNSYVEKTFLNYLVIEYDEKGEGRVTYAKGFDQSIMSNYFMEIEADKRVCKNDISDDILESSFYEYDIKPIKNTRFIYAIPKNVDNNFYKDYDSISHYMNNDERASYSLIEKIAKVILWIILIITLLIPTRLLKRFWGISRYMKLPFEILLGIYILAYKTLFSNDASIRIVRETVNGNILKIIVANGFELEVAKQLVNLFNLGYWFLLFSLAFICTILLKIIFNTGMKNYFTRKSIVLKLVRGIIKKLKLGLFNLLNTDFKKRYNILFIIGVVILVMGILIPIFIAFSGGISVILGIAYIVLVVIFIKLIWCEIKKGTSDYDKLLELTRSIADGNLEKDVEIEDVGSYEEIKRQLTSIQSGYKKIVEDEIKSQKMKSELISNVSHDLKTPLTSILTYTDLLKNERDEEKVKLYIDTIYRKSERLKVLIEDMFEISKAQTGNIKLNINKINIIELLKQSLFEVGDRFEERNIKLRVKYPENKVLLNLDGEKTYRIFENLLVNMSKYALENTRAYIDVFDYETEVRIVLKNISQTEIDYEVDDILERFRRGDKSRNTEGSGLGLSIAKSYAEVQGGKLLIFIDGDLFKAVIVFPKN